MDPKPEKESYATSAAIALASVAIIGFQLVMMQVLSISQWHHFAHMVISTALLGFGAAGTTLAVFRGFFRRNYTFMLPLLLLLCGVTMAFAVTLSGILGDFDAFLLFFERSQIGLLFFFYLIYFLPFFFGGLAITLAFYVEVRRIGSLYFANMAGSGLGAILIIAMLWLFPLEVQPALLGLLPAAGAFLVKPRGHIFTPVFGLGVFLPLLAVINPVSPEPSEYKSIRNALQLPGAEIVHRSSSPYGLLETVRADAQRFAPGLSLQFRGTPPVWDVMFNNGEYFGTIPRKITQDSESGDAPFILDYTSRALPYHMNKPERVLILQSAAGASIAHALSRNAGHVTAVEPHRQAVHLFTLHHPEWNDSLYLDPRVEPVTGSIRTYLERSRQQYDLIKLPVFDTFGGSAGVHALEEQYHLTLEAFSTMWERLSDDGLITATTWLDYPLRYTLKIPVTWQKLLGKKGIENPQAHISAIRSWGTVTYVLSKSPVTSEQRNQIREFGRAMSFDPLLLEDITPEERDYYNQVEDQTLFTYLDDILAGDASYLIDEYPFNLNPAVDDRPFFSHFLKWSSLGYISELYGGDTLPYMEIGFILAIVTFIQIVLISLILIVLPLFKTRWSGKNRMWTLLFFTGTGIGFMFFEIVMIQKMVLYLGLPVYAAAVVLATLLIASGTGSRFSSRLSAVPGIISGAGLIVAVLILIYIVLLSPIISLTIGLPMMVRILLVVVLLGLPAFFMGMLFPLGLRRLASNAENETQIPWACGVDSFLSVTAASLALLIALEAGFNIVMFTAAGAYLLTVIAGLRMGG